MRLRYLSEGAKIVVLNFSSVCQPAKLLLASEYQYEISVIGDDDPHLLEADPSGDARAMCPRNTALPHYGLITRLIAFPFKRDVSQPFFTIIARVGHTVRPLYGSLSMPGEYPEQRKHNNLSS
jgi:hypothetical protein